MNLVLKKEIRLLLPMWGIAMALAIVPPWGIGSPSLIGPGSFWISVIGAALLAVSAFGREFALGTASSLFAQPVRRGRMFVPKLVLVSVALGSVLVAYWASCFIRLEWILGDAEWHYWLSPERRALLAEGFRSERITALLLSSALTAAILAGGLWTSLLLRQVLAAFWATLLLPTLLVVLTVGVCSWFGLPTATGPTCGVLLLYAVVGVIGSWRLFRCAEDVSSGWGSQYLASLRLSVNPETTAAQPRIGRPVGALIRQEMALQKISLIGAAVLLFVNLLSIGLRRSGWLDPNSDTYDLLEGVGILWLLLPLMLGASAIADERRLGTLEARLCLPVSRRIQALLKLGIVVVLGLVFGVVAFVLTEWMGSRLGLSGVLELGGGPWEDGGALVIFVLGLTVVGFYASSLCRSSMQAIGAALPITFLIGLALSLASREYMIGWVIWLHYGVLLTLLTVLSVKNYSRLWCGFPQAARNAAVILGTLLLTAALSAGTFFRVWEYTMPIEPPHGPARLTSSEGVRMTFRYQGILVRLPDGTVSLHRFRLRPEDWMDRLTGDWKPLDLFGGRRRFAGSDWVEMVDTYRDYVGIKSDGSLWVSTSSESLPLPRTAQPSLHEQPIEMTRLEVGDGWKQAARAWRGAILLKNDGTLWQLGPTDVDREANWPGLRAFTPQRLGNDDDWAALFYSADDLGIQKTDGTVWSRIGVRFEDRLQIEQIQLNAKSTVKHAPHLDGRPWRTITWATTRRNMEAIGLANDGTLHGVIRDFPDRGERGNTVQLSPETNWVALGEGFAGPAAALKTDRTLWEWTFPKDLRRYRTPAASASRQLGWNNDWVGVAGWHSGIVALSGDGNLWLWSPWWVSHAYSESSRPMLAASRRPLLLGNIFDAATPASP